MQRNTFRFVLSAAIVVFSHLSTLPALAAEAGDKVQSTLEVGGPGASKMLPLPPGEWEIVQTSEFRRRIGSPPFLTDIQMIDFVLALRAGPDLLMLIHATGNRFGVSQANWPDDPCKRTDFLHRNTYNSGAFRSACLMIEPLTDLSSPDGQELFPGAGQWASKNGVNVPTTALVANFTQLAQNAYLRVSIAVNPALRRLDSAERNPAANPFRRDNLARDPERKRFVDEFVAWSENYMKWITLTRRGRIDDDNESRSKPITTFPSERVASAPSTSTPPKNGSLAEKLTTLKDLKDKGLISDDEFNAMRKKVLESGLGN